ncbi:MAG: sigma-70 family RNA polymerase sigma factor [Alphaproteobacteria bacterium]|nr:sigma-70 family RNA polymerase sigma factor [Alphaproteobacteria bacterium]
MLRVTRAVREDLLGIARRITGDVAEAEDVVQDALLALHEADAVERPDVWLRAVTRNRALDRVRARKPTDAVEGLVGDEAGHDTAGTDAVAAWLPWIVETLPEPYRTAVRRVDLEEVPQATFAAEAGLSASGARTRVQRGRRMLHERLVTCCPVRFEDGEVVDTGVAGCQRC